jgi:sulfur-oxidizing protein SoxY
MNSPRYRRRQVLKAGGGLAVLGVLAAAGVALPLPARAAWNKAAFEGKTIEETLASLGAGKPGESGDIQILASDIAENGAVVPVQVVSKLANTEQIAILVEKNPSMLAALFEIGPDTVADVTTRIKMGQTSNVVAVVKADGKFYTVTKDLKVTLGGCGG